jgi:transcriptional regulator
MYISRLNVQQNAEAIQKYIEENGFATLVCQGDDHYMSSHTPLMLKKESDGDFLYGHLSAANELTGAINKGHKVLAIFMEKHTYISSSWYDFVNVPTWNYIAVHIHGRFESLDESQTRASLHELVTKYEKPSSQPFTLDHMELADYHKMVKGIVAFKIRIEKIDASWKLSQNRDDKNFYEIIKQLRLRGDALSVAIADEMEAVRKK